MEDDVQPEYAAEVHVQSDTDNIHEVIVMQQVEIVVCFRCVYYVDIAATVNCELVCESLLASGIAMGGHVHAHPTLASAGLGT